MTQAAVLGAGSWGTTFAKVLADAGQQVTLWARRREIAEEISTSRTNSAYLPDIPLPSGITATDDVEQAAGAADVVFLAVPAQSLREQLSRIRASVREDAIVVSLIKGLERGTDLRMSEVIAAELQLPAEQIAVLSGPNLAMEIAREEPTASVIACAEQSVAERISQLCQTAYFLPYINTDVTGTELGGVLKNIIGLAVGICDGQQLGDNSKASVITRGLAETTRLGLALGGRQETFAGLAGLGDLVATCGSVLSRNRTAGRLLGQGLAPEQVTAEMTQTAEGMKSAGAVLELARSHRVEMPVCEAVVSVLEGTLTVENIVGLLLARDLKAEVH
ncbi:NAD(P)H-dependent glycerol-3-phosphate dehydrogenase [Nesterenkonia populi]|uniref:NAD(P)H-dependent glycerol-3-phosphate dehydrogenase n=1 Tax=Nesterenkonia populi TaxID=1591087 RepID=UPI0011BDC35A|nr:NAD(P)H-dependent glycerol-3-phosphate dehydrogenase [Nesterenkonia populi]